MGKRVTTDFVHLHVHSHYSLLDGGLLIDDVIRAAKSFGMKSIALTDHGNLFGAIEFYRKALEAGIKPIVGYEAYVAPGSRFEKGSRGIAEAASHLTLLVRNLQGYKNLLKLASIAYLEGFYYRPRIDREVLEKYHEGLLALSGCLSGEISQYLVSHDRSRALEAARYFRDLFGEENFWVELQDTGVTAQATIRPQLVEIARELGLPLVATNDIHYLRREDREAHDVLLCVNTGKLLADENRFRLASDEFYFRSPEEMKAVFSDIPEAIENTKRVADRCNLELSFEEKHLPLFHAPEGKTNAEYLRALCEVGLKKRHGQNVPKEATTRLFHELEIIRRMGYESYFLIVWDFVRFAREQAIPVGPGRGSAAGSIVAYALGVTSIDPLQYGLLFERFLDENRKEMPDIDIDFCQERRGEVIRYVREKYGLENVAQIITFGTMAARGVIRDVGRVLALPYGDVDRIAKMIPAIPGMTLRQALEDEKQLKDLHDSEEKVRRLFDIAKKLEGLARHASIHAAGVVISDKPLMEYVPLYRTGDEVTTQYPMETLEQIGLLKMDFLGLKTLTVIDRAVKLLADRRISLNVEELPLDDRKTYELLGKGEARGVFQFESAGFRELLVDMKPDNFNDLVAAVAIYRPGPIQGGVVKDYIERKHGRLTSDPIHPILDEVLKETHGVMVYQEQVMQILNRLAGIELADAYSIVKAISKKKAEQINSYRETFIDGARQQGVPEERAQEIFQRITYFGGYGFNKSHSAAYAMISYKTAYLKAHYPVEFMAALLSSEVGNTEKVAQGVEECRRMGIEILPPDASVSLGEFSPESDGKIRFGLGAIKNVGTKAIESIIEARSRKGKFRSLLDFCESVDLRLVNKAVLESLIKCGAFDSLGASRAALWAGLDRVLRLASDLQRDKSAGQLALFGAKESALEPVANVPLPANEEWPRTKVFSYEKETVGFYISGHPLTGHKELLETFCNASLAELKDLTEGVEVTVGGIIASVRYTTQSTGARAGERMAFITLEDLTGSADAVLFPGEFEKYDTYVRRESVVILRGRLDLRRETPSIRVSEVIPLEKASEKLAGSITFRLGSASSGPETIRRLRDICMAHPGPLRVYLEVETPEGSVRIRAGDSFSVTASGQLLDEVRNLLGKEAAKVELSARPDAS